jgi:hypothetical protein
LSDASARPLRVDQPEDRVGRVLHPLDLRLLGAALARSVSPEGPPGRPQPDLGVGDRLAVVRVVLPAMLQVVLGDLDPGGGLLDRGHRGELAFHALPALVELARRSACWLISDRCRRARSRPAAAALYLSICA